MEGKSRPEGEGEGKEQGGVCRGEQGRRRLLRNKKGQVRTGTKGQCIAQDRRALKKGSG